MTALFKEGAAHLAAFALPAEASRSAVISDSSPRHTAWVMRELKPFENKTEAEQGESQASLSTVLQEHFQRGFEDGKKVGFELRDRAEQALWHELGMQINERISALGASFNEALIEQEQAMADTLVELALQVARKILAREVQIDRNTTIAVVTECLRAIPAPTSELRVFVNPADLEPVRTAIAACVPDLAIEIVADLAMPVGGARLIDRHCSIDASLNARWQQTLAAIGIEPAELNPSPSPPDS